MAKSKNGVEEHPARVDRFDHPVGIGPPQRLEVPPRDPVLQRHHNCVAIKQRREIVDNHTDLMRFECHHYDVMLP